MGGLGVLKRWLRRDESSHEGISRSLDDLVRSFALILDPWELRLFVASRIRELTHCDQVIYCSFSAPEAAFVSIQRQFALPCVERCAFRSDGRLAKWLEVNQEPLFIPHPGGAFGYLDDDERTRLIALAVRICVPVFLGSKLVGLLLLTSEADKWQISPRDADFLMRLSRQAAIAIEAAELHHIERERLKSASKAEQLALAGKLAAMIAHEVRNPLATIRSTVQFVLDSRTGFDKKAVLLDGLLGEVDRIERTLGGVLALSRPADIEVVEVDLLEVLEQSLLLIETYARSHGVSVARDFVVERLPVLGDKQSLHQLWLNLMLNACQAMSEGGQLTLRATIATHPAAVAMVQLEDTGCGIDTAHLPRVFDPFFTTKRAGTGLGLSICHDVVTRHHGHIKIDSHLGRGTVVTVWIPLR